jgi:hypothetical protein
MRVARWQHRGKSDLVQKSLADYKFIKTYRKLRVSPAMVTGVSDRLWGKGELVGLLEAQRRQKKRHDNGKSERRQRTI